MMGDTTESLYPALFKCFAIILSGYVAGILNLVTKSEAKGIGTFVGTFALPSLIFNSLAQLDFTLVNWIFLGAVLLAKGIVFFSVIIISLIISKPINLGRAGIFAIFCTQSNDFALGYPIINSLYQDSHPEYALYLYLMAPISLAILNPIAFVMMEINKQKERQSQLENSTQYNTINEISTLKTIKQTVKGIVMNPVLVMTVLGILTNIIFKHQLSIYISSLLQVLGDAFAATSLFLLGLTMVGQMHRLRGPALLLPAVLIMVKLIVLPVIMRECVSALEPGTSKNESYSLSTYAFLYGTIPTAPAVFVFSNLYQLEIDLIASSMVICTLVSAPIMLVSAEVISISKDFADQIKRFGFGLSIASLIGLLWLIFVFILTKKYQRMPQRLTFCLIITQMLLAISVIWEGPAPIVNPSWSSMLQQGLQIFSIYSCLLWISMLSVGLLVLQNRGQCFVATIWPIQCFIAWGAPAVIVAVLLITQAHTLRLDGKAADAIRLCLLFFSLIVSAGCLMLYTRFRRRAARLSSLSADVADTDRLIDNSESLSETPSVNATGSYGALTTPSTNRSNNTCCLNDPTCGNESPQPPCQDIEDMATSTQRSCQCPSTSEHGNSEPCPYIDELHRTASNLGLIPPELPRGKGGELLKHTVLIILCNMTMFIGIAYTTWRTMIGERSGVFVIIEFLDVAACYGQGLLLFVLFGINFDDFVIPTIRRIKAKWVGSDSVVLPAVEDLSFETKHVCDQFITHHLERCRESIAKDRRWRMRTYRGAFRGTCLTNWLQSCGLAKDEQEAVIYGRHLLDGRLIAHISNAHHFTNTPMLYVFK